MLVLTLMVSSARLIISPATGDEEKATVARPEPSLAHESLIEFILPNRQAVEEMIDLGADLVETVNDNDDGTATVYAYVTPAERRYFEALGFESGKTLEDYSTYLARMQERAALMTQEEAALEFAEDGRNAQVESAAVEDALSTLSVPIFEEPGAITIQRADYFENYAGRFLSVEASVPFTPSTPVQR